jgi:hypothetical protein
MQVKELGKSESFTVIVKIAVQILPHSKEGRLPSGDSITRNLKHLLTKKSKRYDQLYASHIQYDWK